MVLFWVVFPGALLTAIPWYRFGLVLSDPHSILMWLGTSYLAAYAAVELYRRPSVLAGLLLIPLTLLFWNDISRHANLLSQSENPFLRLLGMQFSTGSCIFEGSTLACVGVEVLVDRQRWIFGALFVILVLIAARRLLEIRK
jgi:hypothetical protein